MKRIPHKDDKGLWHLWTDYHYHRFNGWDDFFFTGRIKYRKEYGMTMVSFEIGRDVEVKDYATVGRWLWKRKVECGSHIETETIFVDSSHFRYREYPVEVIYECTTESTPSGDSCCENHW